MSLQPRSVASLLTFVVATALIAASATSVDAGKKKKKKKNKSAPMAEIESGFMRAPYLQSLEDDRVIIAWIAAAEGAAELDFGPTLAYGTTVTAHSDGARRHVELSGLTPGTTYYYRVRAGERVLAAGEELRFRTDEGAGDRTFSFFVTGDIGAKNGDQSVTSRAILDMQPRPELGILCGDIVYSKGRSSEYDRRLMRPWRELLRTIPVWPALGNHDWKSAPESNWQLEWYLPHNEHYYSFDYANAHFVALDTRDGDVYDRDNQVRWLEADLEANRDAEWTFVYYHHPAITCTYKRDNAAVSEAFLPLFDRYGVDAVFQGHAHTYERLFPIRHGEPVNQDQDPDYVDPEGTVYIVSGAGGKYKKDKPTTLCGPTAFFKDETILWTEVQVDGGRCTIRSYESASGKLVDEVTITKSSASRASAP